MPDIKTKARGTVKTLDRSRIGIEKLKDNIISIKEKTENTYKEDSYSNIDYATNKVEKSEKNIVKKGFNELNKQGIKSVEDTKENIKRVEGKLNFNKNRFKENEVTNKSIIKSKEKFKNIKNKIKTSNNNLKLYGKSIKTTEKVAKNSIKLAKEAAEKTVEVTKAAIKAMIHITKAIIQATSALIKLLIAGGWVSIIIILVVCLFGGILAIFNSGGDEDTRELWNNDIVIVAESQLGVTGGDPYWSWYGFESRVEWCACFVSWCADQVGYIKDGIVPKFSVCTDGINWYKEKGLWFDNVEDFIPVSGDIIFFDWKDKESGNQDGVSDHVGIVKKYDMNNHIITTIEGNSGDECKERSYNKDDIQILGFGSNRLQLVQ